MFSPAYSCILLTTVAIFASILTCAAIPQPSSSQRAADELLPLYDEIIQQALYSNSPLFAGFDSSSLVDLQQLLQSDAFKQNMSLTLNISTENLTDLLNTAQLNQTWDFPHQQHTKLVLIWLSMFYGFIILAGIVGNLITCVVIAKHKFMHTATNMYLFNLAISDFLLLITGAPQDIYSYWNPNNSFSLSSSMCKLLSIVAESASNATVLTITAFTVERYVAICHPFRQHKMSKLSRVYKFVMGIWVVAVVLAMPQASQFSVVVEPASRSCTMDNHEYRDFFALSGFVFFIVPMTAISVLYILIALKLKHSRMLRTAPRRRFDKNRSSISSQGRVINMLAAVAIAFLLCWLPFHAQRLMAVYGSYYHANSPFFKTMFDIVDMISGMLYYLSTCINPLLYNIMSHKFRDAFKATFGRPFGLHCRSQSQSHNYSTLLRQNGSMRLHTTVNSNCLDNYHSFRVLQLHCRDPSHHLSLQDSIRTTTTTTTIHSSAGFSNSVGGGGYNNASIRSSRYTSIGTQSPIIKYGTTTTGATSQPNHKLQSQLSHRSSGGDSNFILDMELDTRNNYCHSSRCNHLHRSMFISNAMNHNGSARRGQQANNDDSESINSQEWDSSASQYEYPATHCMDEYDNDSLAQPPTSNSLNMTRRQTIVQAMQQPVQLVNTIAEVDMHAPSRTRLKLSRIVSRRDQDALLAQPSPRAELMRTNNVNVPPNVPDSPFMTYENDKKKHLRRSGVNGVRRHKTLDTLNGIFHWRARKKELNTGRRRSGKKSTRNDSTSTTHTHLSRVGTPTPRVALMRSISSATPAPRILESTLNGEMVGQK